MGLYLALDVGGTKTAALLADENTVLAQASAGSIKTLRVSPSEAARELQKLLAALEQQSGLRLQCAVARTCIGSSGMSAPAVREWYRAAFTDAVGGELLLLGDEVIALDGAFQGGRGVLVIAGTGSNIVGRTAAGHMVHTGGWGPALADEGSGHWIGTAALRACFRSIDSSAPCSADRVLADGHAAEVAASDLPPLLQRFLPALGLGSLDEVIGAANAPGFHSAALVPVVAEAARAGDELARGVLAQAGRDLADLVKAVILKLARLEPGLPPEVAFVGSILTHVHEVREAMHETLNSRFPGIVLHQQPTDPLKGALWHASKG